MMLGTMLALLVATTVAGDRQAPADWAHVVPRLSQRTRWVFGNLRYEGNNRALRADAGPTAQRCADAERTRALADRTAGLFVLRDALFSQQDHPIEQRACALMLPINWVTAVVDDAMAGRTTAPVLAPPLDDDAAWAAVVTAGQLFGGFQASDALHGWAVRSRADASPDDRARIDNARAAVHSLAADAKVLLDAAPGGAAAIAAAGGELIAASDRAYFGERTRHDRVIPLVVEHPSAHEIIDEHKGLVVHGRVLDPAAIALVREVVYRRRLADGALAIERYDLTQPDDVRRIVELLERLVPEGRRKGHRVYVWAGGSLVPGTERVVDVHDRMPELVAALDAGAIEMSRVTVFARPVFQSKGNGRAQLEDAVDRAREHGVLHGVNMTGDALRSMMKWR